MMDYTCSWRTNWTFISCDIVCDQDLFYLNYFLTNWIIEHIFYFLAFVIEEVYELKMKISWRDSYGDIVCVINVENFKAFLAIIFKF